MTNKEYSIPHHGLTPAEKEAADAQLRELRGQSLKRLTEYKKIYAELISLKFRIVDYIDLGSFNEKFLFAEVLKEYVSILKMTRRKVAKDLGIHETKFSKLINDKENPGLGVLYRIEEHSGGILDASLLWELVSKKLNEEIRNDVKERSKQSRMVSNKLQFKKTA